MTCDDPGCQIEATFYQARIESRQITSEKHLCERHAEAFFIDFRSTVISDGGVQRTMVAAAACVELELISYCYFRQNTSSPACVYLHEVGGTRRMCMLIDGWAWFALTTHLKREVLPRPHTHTGWAATMVELGGKLQAVVLDKCEGEQWWSSKARIIKDDRIVSVDIRPSDACILALIQDAPMFVMESALERFADRGGAGSNE